MRLVAFSIRNYRSITEAHKIPIGDSTILIGKNNEGKSNVLRALDIAMKALATHADDQGGGPGDIREMAELGLYSWRRDFPISLQQRVKGTESIFRLEFSLDHPEVEEFRKNIGSALNGNLPIEIKFGKGNTFNIHVPKRGRGGNALSAKSSRIAKYIAERIDFNFIPAIRTEDEALSVVQEMLSRELRGLEKDAEYVAAVRTIGLLQQPILDRIGASIHGSLKQFLPNIKAVRVMMSPSARRLALRSQCRVEIDDGTPTLLEYKGDGVKSLAALSLLKDKNKSAGASIIAIEEPESHLHPGAMHSLYQVIETLSHDNQVVLTTHCPLFVDRANVSRNVIIEGSSAKRARDISALRTLLGVRASDNLVNASHVLIVEGPKDAIILKSLLPQLSPILAKAIKQHHLVVEPIGGAGNLSYKLSLLSNALCVSHTLLDGDAAGKNAYSKAEEDNLLRLSDVTFVNRPGSSESELEDCFETASYANEVLTEFGVDLNDNVFRGNPKWSDRAEACFNKQGKVWSSRLEARVKAHVAMVVSKNPESALNPNRRESIDALVRALEQKIATAKDISS